MLTVLQKEEHRVSVLEGHQIQCMVCKLCSAYVNFLYSIPQLGSQSYWEQKELNGNLNASRLV